MVFSACPPHYNCAIDMQNIRKAGKVMGMRQYIWIFEKDKHYTSSKKFNWQETAICEGSLNNMIKKKKKLI